MMTQITETVSNVIANTTTARDVGFDEAAAAADIDSSGNTGKPLATGNCREHNQTAATVEKMAELFSNADAVSRMQFAIEKVLNRLHVQVLNSLTVLLRETMGSAGIAPSEAQNIFTKPIGNIQFKFIEIPMFINSYIMVPR